MASSRFTESEGRRIIQEIECKQQEVVDQSLESTRRMQLLCVESTEAGAKTLGMLQCQGEQLNRLAHDMDEIDTNVRQADKNLTKMQRCCGLDLFPCRERSSVKDDSVLWKNDGNGKVVNRQPKKGAQKRTEIKSQVIYLEKITNDAREDEMENNILEVSNMVDGLRNMALNMHVELEGHNKQIQYINEKAEMNAIHIEVVNQRAKHLL